MNDFFAINPQETRKIAIMLVEDLTKMNGNNEYIYKTFKTFDQIDYVVSPLQFFTTNEKFNNTQNKDEEKIFTSILEILYDWYYRIYKDFDQTQRDYLLIETIKTILPITQIERGNTFHVLEKIVNELQFEISENTWKTIITIFKNFASLVGKPISSKVLRLVVYSLDKAKLSTEESVAILQGLTNVLSDDDKSFVEKSVQDFLQHPQDSISFLRSLWMFSPKNIMISAFQNILIDSKQYETLFIPKLPAELILKTFGNHLFSEVSINVYDCLAFSQLFGVFGTKNEEWLNLFIKFIKAQVSKQNLEINLAICGGLTEAITAHPKQFSDVILVLLNYFYDNPLDKRSATELLQFCILADQIIDPKDPNYKYYSFWIKKIIENNYKNFSAQAVSVDIIFLALKHQADILYPLFIKKLPNSQFPYLMFLIAAHYECVSHEKVSEIILATLKKISIVTFAFTMSLLSVFVRFNITEDVKKSLAEIITTDSKQFELTTKEILNLLVASTFSLAPVYILDTHNIKKLAEQSEGEKFYVCSQESLFCFSNTKDTKLLVIIYGVFGVISFISDAFDPADPLPKKVFYFFSRAGLDVFSNEVRYVDSRKHQKSILEIEREYMNPSIYLPISNVCFDSSDFLSANSIVSSKFADFVDDISDNYESTPINIQLLHVEDTSKVPVSHFPAFNVVYISKHFFSNESQNDISRIFEMSNSIILFNDTDYKFNKSKLPPSMQNIVQVISVDDEHYAFKFLRCSDNVNSINDNFTLVRKEEIKTVIFSALSPYIFTTIANNNPSYSMNATVIIGELHDRSTFIDYIYKVNNSPLSSIII